MQTGGKFTTGEFYHIYNRGVEKRDVFSEQHDVSRFFKSMEFFNSVDPIGSIYEVDFANKKFGRPTSKSDKLVNFVCYCLNPNHYHFILEQVVDGGISEFMKRLGGGYTKYFNEKYKRSGALFQGKFKSIHVMADNYLLHLSAYINLNDRVHQFGRPTSKLVGSRSSWGEYIGNGAGFCCKDIVLGQFKDVDEYKKFAEESLRDILERRSQLDDVESFLLE